MDRRKKISVNCLEKPNLVKINGLAGVQTSMSYFMLRINRKVDVI